MMKRTLLLTAIAASLFTACTDRSCTINGNITGLEGDGWINVCDDKEHNISSLYGIWGIPDNVMIDCSTGIIVKRDLRGKHLNEELNSLLK